MSKTIKMGADLLDNNGAWQQNADGSWSEAIPYPLMGLKNQCRCGKSFWKIANYERHYREMHTDGKKYYRNFTGLHPYPVEGED